jgi:hypothetical protein
MGSCFQTVILTPDFYFFRKNFATVTSIPERERREGGGREEGGRREGRGEGGEERRGERERITVHTPFSLLSPTS